MRFTKSIEKQCKIGYKRSKGLGLKRREMKKLIEVQSINSFLSPRTTRFVLALVIFMSMLINSFVPKSVENKESILVIMGAIASNVIVETFKQCNETLTQMSNKITKDLYKYLRLGEVGTDVPVSSGQKQGEEPVNTSSDNGLEIVSRQYKELITESEGEGLILLGEGKEIGRLYRLYNNVKLYNSVNEKIGLLFFIIFVVAVRSRKEGISRTLLNMKMEDKTNLC